MRGLRAAPQYLLYAFALAWPLDLYQYVPYLNITVTGALTIALLLLAAQNIASGAKLRVPFDILFPIGPPAGTHHSNLDYISLYRLA